MSDSCKVNLEDCKLILEKCFGDNNYELLEFTQESLSKKVQGIMAGHFKIYVKVKVNNEIVEKTFFEKRMKSKYPIQDEVIKLQGAYKKEAFMYNFFFKELNKVPNFHVCFIPECYLLSEDSFIVLEDLSADGYQANRSSLFLLDFEHCKLTLKALAKFHAGTIIYEQQQSTKNGIKYSLMDDHAAMFHDSLYRKDDKYLGNILYKNFCQTLINIINISSLFDINRTQYKEVIIQNFENLYELVKASKDFRNVVCHGDLWTNNILFQYEGDVPVACKIIDFQALRYTVPAHDVLNLVYNAGNSAFTKQKMDILLQHYHNALTEHLQACDIDVNQHITYEDFEKSCDWVQPMIVVQRACFSLFFALNTVPDILEDPEKFRDFFYGETMKYMCVELYKTDKNFRNVMDDVFQDLMKLKSIV